MTHPAADVGILVVDDEETMRVVVCDVLKDAGFRVADASSPAQALEALSTTPFDIVFTDLNMSGSTGIDLLRELRTQGRNIQVVIMTADPSLDSAIEATRLGAADYLRKPFSSLDDVVTLAASLAAKVREERAKDQKAPPTAAPAKETKETKELAGNIADFPLHEVLQLLGMLRKNGLLRIDLSGSRVAYAGISPGVVHSAEFGAARDLKAIFRLLTIDEGSFRFRSTPLMSSPARIKQSTEWVVMEGLRHRDEINALPERPPSDAVLHVNVALDPTGVTGMSFFDLAVAEKLQKPMTMGALLDALPEPDLDIYKAVVKLRKARLLSTGKAKAAGK